MRGRWAIAVLTLVTATALVPARADTPTIRAWPLCVARTSSIAVGASEVKRTPVDARITDVTLASKAMRANEHVDVMVPPGYGASPSTRYAVLYLLHGALGSYTDWPSHDVEGLVGSLPVIVVMPDDGTGGSYSDWYGTELGDLGSAPAWETFHVRELIPWIDAHYRTIAAPRGRYIAGLSSGGGGAMKYATANPGMFAAAGEFSGAVDTDLPGYYGTADVTWDLSYIPFLGPPGHCTWGDPAVHRVIWEDNDPTYKAANLAGTRLYLASGNGQPGPYDSKTATPDVVEETVWQMNEAFDAALRSDHVAHTTEFYGPGTHAWPYWQRDLTHFLSFIRPTLAKPIATPPAFAVRSARATFAAWDWSFTTHRVAREFMYLTGVGAGGFTAAGSGDLDVVTAALYTPLARYTVSGAERRAGNDGRLRFTVKLGPAHTEDQTDFGPDAASSWTRVNVAIAPVTS